MENADNGNRIMAQLEPTTANFIKKLAVQGKPPIYKLPINEAREVLNTVQKGPVEEIPVSSEDISIPAGPRGTIDLRVIRPNDGVLPVIMVFHGGGWILGNEHTHEHLIRKMAYITQAAVVFVKYTPSPEAHYPVPLEEAYAATEYIAQHGNELNLDTSRLAVAGDSVGGNMATVVTLLAKERKGPSIIYQILLYPVTDASLNTRSYEEFADGPWLTKAAMEWFWNAYEPNKAARNQYTMSPLKASLDQLQGLPPALIITAENDVLRDEGEAYAHKLMQAGVQVKAVRCIGTIHDFLMLNALANTSPTQAAMSLIQATMQEVLSSGR